MSGDVVQPDRCGGSAGSIVACTTLFCFPFNRGGSLPPRLNGKQTSVVQATIEPALPPQRSGWTTSPLIRGVVNSGAQPLKVHAFGKVAGVAPSARIPANV